MNNPSLSFNQAKKFLGQVVNVVVDRPIGSKHPKWNFEYTANYGFIEGIVAPDGEELDAYVLGIDGPVEKYTGKVFAIVHRLEDDDDKLVVLPEDKTMNTEEIEKAIEFQEKWFKHEIIYATIA